MRLLAAILPLLLLLSGKVAFAQTVADWNTLVQAAKKEGKVVVYSSSVGVPDYVAIAKAFEAKFGITVEILEGRGSEITERVRTETSLNRPSADVLYQSEGTLELYRADKLLVPIGPTPLLHNFVPPFSLDEFIVPMEVNSYGILINTDLVSEADAPKSWQDLLDPKWRGKILADDPRALGGANVVFSVLLEKFGQDYLKKLAMQNLQFARDQRNSQRRIARGEFPIYIPFTMTDILRLEGLPVRAISPTEGNPYALFSLAMLKGGQHPNAARLLINYFFEPSSIDQYHANGKSVTVAADISKLTPELTALIHVKSLGEQDPALIETNLSLFSSIYK